MPVFLWISVERSETMMKTKQLMGRWAMVLLAAMVFVQGAKAGEKAFRTVPIPAREHGYSGVESRVIGSQAELDGFLKEIRARGAWNKREKFEKAIADAKLDFSKESLVLLRYTEGSGSTVVTMEKPKLSDGTLGCDITRKTAGIGTTDMAYYCYAFAVKKNEVKEVELRLAGRKSVVLPVKKNAGGK